MVVGSDGQRFDPSIDEKLGEDGLELGLSGLQVVTSNEGLVALSKLDSSRDECVLRSTIDERLSFENGSYSEKSRGGDFGMGRLDRSEQVICGVVDTRDEVTVMYYLYFF